MKPLPILLTAAGLAVAAASTYVWMGSGSSAAPMSRAASTSHAGAPGAGGEGFSSSTPETQNGGAALSSFAEKARLGRSFRASDAADPEPAPVVVAAAAPGYPASETDGISTDYLHNTRRHAGGDGMLPTSRGANGQPAGPESGPAVVSSIGFGALADTSFGTGQEATSGILSHPGIVPPAAPKFSGAVAVPPSNDGSLANAVPPGFNVGGTQATDPSNTPVQRGGRPAWPTGPFTPEQELYRAQIGSANFDLWLTDEARKQRPDLQ